MNIGSEMRGTGAEGLHETGFFRDREVFETLREIVLPRLITTNADARRLRIWCAAAATGQEVYSVAMMLRESFADALAGWDVKIVGTDLSSGVMEYARSARYQRAQVNRGLPARMLVKYFVRDGEDWSIEAELRALCEFREGDVRTPRVEAGGFDLVLMRNVLLSLPAHDHAAVFANLHRQMAPHGVLVLGQAEQAEDSTEVFEAESVRGCCFYRKAASG